MEKKYPANVALHGEIPKQLDKDFVGAIGLMAIQLGIIIGIAAFLLMVNNKLFHYGALTVAIGLISYRLWNSLGNREKQGALENANLKATASQYICQKSVLTVSSVCIVLFMISNPVILKYFDYDVAMFFQGLSDPRLNKREVTMLERGYYEGLLHNTWFNSQIVDDNSPPPYWPDSIEQTSAGRATDDFLRIKLVPNIETVFLGKPFITNEWGMRDQAYVKEKPSNIYRIAILGPSHAMGLGVGNDDTFENLLEERLNREFGGKTFSKYEVLNFAISDYTTLHQPLLIQETVSSFNPDMIMYVAHIDVLWTIDHLVDRIGAGVEVPYSDLQEIVKKAGIEQNTPPIIATRKLKALNSEIVGWAYKRIVALSKESDSIPIWFYLPLVGEYGDDIWQEEVEKEIQLAKEAGFVTMNMSNVFEGTKLEKMWLAPWDRHPNELGHERIANKLFEEVSRVVLEKEALVAHRTVNKF